MREPNFRSFGCGAYHYHNDSNSVIRHYSFAAYCQFCRHQRQRQSLTAVAAAAGGAGRSGRYHWCRCISF